VGRSYAGILGSLAFLTTVLRGWIAGAGTEQVLFQASLSMFALAVVGAIAGALAGWIVEDSVETKIAAELEAQENAPKTPPKK
jgi:outer membrane lipoprotein SlyB